MATNVEFKAFRAEPQVFCSEQGVICILVRRYDDPELLALAMEWAIEAGHSFTSSVIDCPTAP